MHENLTAYYAALDPEERLTILNHLEAEEQLLRFLRVLYQERYTDPKDPGRRVDQYLWKCVYLPGLYRRRKLLRGALRREVQQTLQELHLSQPETLSAQEKECLYREFRNAARRYLGTCKGERYGRSLLGLKRPDPERKLELACEDIWGMSRGLALAAEKEGPMTLWIDALRDEWLEFTPQAQALYEKTDTMQRRKL